MAATSSTYKGCVIFTEYVGGSAHWIAFVRESDVTGMGVTPTEAIHHMMQVMDQLGPWAIDGGHDVGT